MKTRTITKQASAGAEFARRRAALRASLGNALFVIEGNTESERGELRSGFFQDPNFFYLTGWREPGAALVLAPAAYRGAFAEVLFLPDRDESRTLWTGPATDASDENAARRLGVARVARRSQLEGILARLLDAVEAISCVPESPIEPKLKRAFPFRPIFSARDGLARLRMTKSASEIARIRDAVRITAEGQTRAFASLQRASNEYEVAADITHEFLRLGAERHAFAPIVAAGPNACVLHYSRNRGPLRKGDLAIVDVGAERDGYAGDLTRTIPVGGRFSRRQREIYESVLAVQEEIIRELRPGASIARQIPGSLHQLAVSRFAEMRIGPKRKALSEYFPHGIGHHLGMDVHDLCDPLARLAPGMIVTIEPGVYIPEEGIGIRIEDDVLVTSDGAEVLSNGLPKTVADLEALLRR